MRTKIIAILALVFLTTSLSAQWGWKNRVKGSGDIETQERSVESRFTEVKSCCSMEVMITKGNERSVSIEADDNILEYIETDFNGSRLTIRTSRGANIEPSQRVKVSITMPTIEGLYASSSSDLIAKGAFSGDELELDVSSSGEIMVDFTGSEVDIEGSSSGRIKLRGRADVVKADLSSSSKIDATDFTAKRLKAEASSSGRISIEVTDEIDADVSSSGKVYYSGNPSKVFSDASSGGKVKKME
ncbi:MAG: head GIN domain-containing protein [Bacteroidota bacterium]